MRIALALILVIASGALAQSQLLTLEAGGKGAAGVPPTPCLAAQFDFSAGCNAIFLTGVMRP